MLDFVLVCASTVLVCASTVLVCASTVLVCASICFFVLARKSTRKHISFGDDSTHATYGTHMYIPVSVNTYVLIQDLAAAPFLYFSSLIHFFPDSLAGPCPQVSFITILLVCSVREVP